MSYLVSGDKSNDWEPATGASGASAAAGTPKTLFFLRAAQGSVIELEDQDGSMSARYRYDEFGVAEAPEKFDLNWSGPDNLFGYTSLGYDYYSGYSHAQARDFDSSVGRFIIFQSIIQIILQYVEVYILLKVTEQRKNFMVKKNMLLICC